MNTSTQFYTRIFVGQSIGIGVGQCEQTVKLALERFLGNVRCRWDLSVCTSVSCLDSRSFIVHYNCYRKVFKKRRLMSFFVRPLTPQFWTSGDVCPGFHQSQGGLLACLLSCPLIVTSGPTPADYLVVSLTAELFQLTYFQTYPQALVVLQPASECAAAQRCKIMPILPFGRMSAFFQTTLHQYPVQALEFRINYAIYCNFF